MTVVLFVVCFFALLSSSVYGAMSIWPSNFALSTPLFQKSPYFNAWIGEGIISNGPGAPVGRWPRFFHRRELRWFFAVRVDNTSYTIQGYDGNYTNEGTTISTYVLPTQTRFTIQAGPVLVNLTYLAPIDLQDWTLHSLPFAYTAIDMISIDGNPHYVQLYTDTTAQFLSPDDSSVVKWNTSLTAKSIYHMAEQVPWQSLTEKNDMSEDGTQVFAYAATPGVSMTWQTNLTDTCRSYFALRGKLGNATGPWVVPINNSWPVMAYALDLGKITRTSNPLVFGMGLIRNPVVSYRTGQTTKNLSHLWHARWSDIGSAVDDFLTSYPSASSRANAFDDHIQLNASALATQLNMSIATTTNLVDLHILNLRQTIGSLEFTTLKPGEPLVMDDVRVFMKDVGYSRRTNPVEIIYASFPAFLFFNATLAGKLLEPLFEFQASSLYKNKYAAPDLGNSYPIINGNTTDQSLLAIDSCGAMLIMALAHARKSGDGTLLFKYYDLLRQWADHLVQITKQPGSYMSSDELYSSTVNLALKGIVGLYAMGEINRILEARGADTSKSSYYLTTANSYAEDWLNRAISSDHVMASYRANSTWAMMYNLFAPRLLGAPFIPEHVYETQASWYATQGKDFLTGDLTSTATWIPYDSTQATVKAHWALLSASSVFNATSSGGRDALMNMVHDAVFFQGGVSNPTSYASSPTNNIGTQVVGGAASPAMGSVYSLLALNLSDFTTITLPSGNVTNSGLTVIVAASKVPVILGATFGVLGGSILLFAVLFIWRRRRRSKAAYIDSPFEELPRPSNITPVKFSTIQVLPHVENGNSLVDRSSRGGPADGANLRQEVEQLRMMMEMFSAQQPVDQQGSLPDEPPPTYLSSQ